MERVLAVRELRKLIAEQKLGAVLRDMSQIECTLEESQLAALENQTLLRHLMFGTLDVDIIRDSLNLRKSMMEDIAEIEKQLAQIQIEVRHAQREVIKKNQKLKTLSKLKQKQKQNYQKAYWWEHSKQMDQIGVQHFNKKKERR